LILIFFFSNKEIKRKKKKEKRKNKSKELFVGATKGCREKSKICASLILSAPQTEPLGLALSAHPPIQPFRFFGALSLSLLGFLISESSSDRRAWGWRPLQVLGSFRFPAISRSLIRT